MKQNGIDLGFYQWKSSKMCHKNAVCRRVYKKWKMLKKKSVFLYNWFDRWLYTMSLMAVVFQTRNESGLVMGEWMGMVDFICFSDRDCQLPALKSLLQSKNKTEHFPDPLWLGATMWLSSGQAGSEKCCAGQLGKLIKREGTSPSARVPFYCLKCGFMVWLQQPCWTVRTSWGWKP